MQYRITPTVTMPYMEHGDRRYDEECADHARELLRRWVDEKGGQVKAGEILGVHQSTIARSLAVDKQPSLKILLSLSKATGWTLEHILGLTPPAPPPVPARFSDSELLRVATKVAEQVQRRMTPPEMPAAKPPAKKAPKPSG